MLKLTQANAQCANLACFKLVDRMGRKNGYRIKFEKTCFIDQSITGLYEKRYQV